MTKYVKFNDYTILCAIVISKSNTNVGINIKSPLQEEFELNKRNTEKEYKEVI